MSERKNGQEKAPISPVEIERCRKKLKVGQQVTIRALEWDLDFRHRVIQRKCVVEEKHRWIFVVRDQRGRLHAVTYVDMIMQGGV